MKRIFINFGAFLPYSRCNGPGLRAVIWVKGCSIRCKGCFNPSLIKKTPQNLIEVKEIIKKIKECRGVEGVTITGGEPFDQPEACFEISREVKKMGLNLLIFTGYTFSKLKKQKSFFVRSLIEISDILVTGPYIEKLRCSSPLKGSRNQKIIILNKKISLSKKNIPSFEVILSKKGETIISGFPPKEVIKSLIS